MKTKKWRDVKNALVMVVVMAAMMSTATYAWFTLTSNATVTGMQMTAGGSSGLQVSLDKAKWADSVDLTDAVAEGEDPNKMIHQVTVKPNELGKFYKPLYAEEQVTGDEVIASTDLSTYVAKYTYHVRTVDGSEKGVGIVTAQGTTATDGSYIRATDTDDDNSAAYAVRVGIVVDGNWTIFEPNHEDETNGGKSATDARTEKEAAASDVVAADSGVIVEDKGKGKDNYTSVELFKTSGSEGKEVTMYVWLEGTDDDCVDQIKADELAGQITFTIVGE